MAMAVPLIAAAAPAIIGAISNKGSDKNVQSAQAARQGITARAADEYRQSIGGLQPAINDQTRSSQQHAEFQPRGGAMYGQPLTGNPQTPPSIAMNFGPQPGQVAPGVSMGGPPPQGPQGPPQGPPPQTMNPMHIMGAMQRQQGPDAYQQMQPASPDALNRMTILSALGAGPHPGNVAPTAGPMPGPGPGPSPFNPSRIMGGR